MKIIDFSRLDGNAKRIILVAGYEVRQFGHSNLRIEHFLLAFLKEGHLEDQRIFLKENIDPGLLESTLRKSLRKGRRTYRLPTSWAEVNRPSIIPWSNQAKAVLLKELNCCSSELLRPEAILRRILDEPSRFIEKVISR